MSRQGKLFLCAAMVAALLLAPAGAASDVGSLTPAQAKSYLEVLAGLEEKYGPAKHSEMGLWTGLTLARLVDFNGDSVPELLCAYGAPKDAYTRKQSVWTLGPTGAAALMEVDTSNFGTDVSPVTQLYAGGGNAYLVTGQEVMNGGEVHYWTLRDGKMTSVLHYTDGLVADGEETVMVNGKPLTISKDRAEITLNGRTLSSREELKAVLEALTQGMAMTSYSYWQDLGAKTVPETITALLQAAAPTASPSAVSLSVDGRISSPAAYLIRDNNYLKLRDLAMALSGTGKQFDVQWNQMENRVELTSGRTYTPVGGELVPGTGATPNAVPTTAAVWLDGKPLALTAYTIADNNYFKLRDLGRALNFGVDWDGSTGLITISTKVGYTEA